MGSPSQSFAPVITASGTEEECFPDVDPNFEPFGNMVLLQVRVAKRQVSRDSRIELPDDVRATIQANTQVAKVVSLGPLCFCNRNNGNLWPEGEWFKVGDYVRIPRHTGDRWEVSHGSGEVITFVLLRELDVPGRIPRPLDVIAYV